MTRTEIEDALLIALKANFAGDIDVEAMGPQDRRFYDVRNGSAIRVFYTQGGPRGDQQRNSGMHADDWGWSVVVISKDYRSAQSGKLAALEMLELVGSAVSGVRFGSGRFFRRGDQLYPVPEASGLTAYADMYTINAFSPRG